MFASRLGLNSIYSENSVNCITINVQYLYVQQPTCIFSGKISVLCKCAAGAGTNKTSRHWHCSVCPKTVSRRDTLEKHLAAHIKPPVDHAVPQGMPQTKDHQEKVSRVKTEFSAQNASKKWSGRTWGSM